MTSRLLAATVIAGTMGFPAMLVALPAVAAALPDGQRITVVDHDDEQFFEVAPGGSLSRVGVGADNYAPTLTGIDVDDDGVGYAVATAYDGGSPVGGWFYAADATTGILSGEVPVEVQLGESSEPVLGCNAIDVAGGAPLIGCFVFATQPDRYVNYVGTVDPATGILQPEFTLEGADPWFGTVIESIARDPALGTLWAFTYEEGVGTRSGVYVLEGSGAALTTTTATTVFGADFDRAGQLWVTTDAGPEQVSTPTRPPELATLDPASGNFLSRVPFTLDGTAYPQFIAPLTVWGRPALPATGVAPPQLVAAAAAAVMLLGTAVLGAAVFETRRRRTA